MRLGEITYDRNSSYFSPSLSSHCLVGYIGDTYYMLATLTSVKADRATLNLPLDKVGFLILQEGKQFSIESILRKQYLIALPKVVVP